LIARRYRLESLIGEGGAAAVWRAIDTTLERPVAIKLLYGGDKRDRARRISRFEREARIAGAVRHPNVVQIVDFGTTDDTPYMVMEMLDGESLAVRIKREPRLELTAIVRIVVSILRGLDAVHTAGIVHRDIKPGNVFLHREGDRLVPKILDFGISRLVEPDGKRVSALTTTEGVIVGTPEYMSPEQVRGSSEIDLRTDIYSVGVMLYELLLGKVPYKAENVGDLLISIVNGNAPSLHAQRPDVPRAVADVVHKAMARNPGERHASALELRQALLTATESASPPAERASSLLPRAERHGWVWPAAGTLTAACLLLLWALGAATTGDVHDPANGAQAEQTLPAPPRPRALVTAAPRPATITVELRGVPGDASVTVDGEVARQAPLRLPRDGRDRLIRVNAPDRTPWQVAHRASADAVYDVELFPARPAPPKAAQRSRPRPAVARQRAAGKPPRAFQQLDF
jgi:tRNA A-37 threonylcarbamoyl transferase component Bud32